jgi:hypothetical protein
MTEEVRMVATVVLKSHLKTIWDHITWMCFKTQIPTCVSQQVDSVMESQALEL